jgi:multiple sugar transport system permease protein
VSLRAPWIGRTLLYLLAFAMALWVIAPVYFIAIGAFSTQDDLYKYPRELWPHHFSTDALSFFLHSTGTMPALERSVMVAAITLAFSLAVGVPAGYALARFAFRGADAFRLLIVSTRAFPIMILAIPLSVTFIRWGIDDSLVGVAIAHTALALPFAVLTTSSVFAGISDELEEAAMTLGCSRAKAVLKVILPLALPGLAAAAIFVFIISWNDVFAASVLTLRHRTLPAQVLTASGEAPLPYRVAGGFFLLAPSLVVIFFIRKYLFNMWGRVVK